MVKLLETRTFVVPGGTAVAAVAASLLGQPEPSVARQLCVRAHDHRGEQAATCVVLRHRQRPQQRYEIPFESELAPQLLVRDRRTFAGELDEPLSQCIHGLYLPPR